MHRIHVHLATLAELESWRSAFTEILSGEELARADRMHPGAPRELFVAGRGWLRTLLGAASGTAPGRIEFETEPGGRPVAVAPADLPRFSVSHSGEVVAIALGSGHPVGVDVELVGPRGDPLDLARRWFGEDEVPALARLAPAARTAAFRRAWCRKEAVLKALGVGLSDGLGDVPVGLEPGRADVRPIRVRGRDLHLCDLPERLGVAGAVAAEGAPFELVVHARPGADPRPG